ncbi:arginase [Vibrio vulnificus]|nr:arginase [Vibrio vulnificus]EHI9274283.1 arginase [Vibrio vulnificus]
MFCRQRERFHQKGNAVMLGFFKRNQKNHTVQHHHYPYSFITVSEYIKPMTVVEFESAQQSLENASEWLYQSHPKRNIALCAHFSHHDVENGHYQETLSQMVSRHAIPVVLTNCHETLLSALPVVLAGHEEVGLMNINHNMGLKSTLNVKLGSAYHFALTRYPNSRAFFVGVSQESTANELFEYAEDLGSNWLTEKEFSFRHRYDVKEQIGNFIDHCDKLVLSIDLASLVTKANIDNHHTLDIQMVLRTLRQCIVSGKVSLIQLIGSRDGLIFSRECKAILEELEQLTEFAHHAA